MKHLALILVLLGSIALLTIAFIVRSRHSELGESERLPGTTPSKQGSQKVVAATPNPAKHPSPPVSPPPANQQQPQSRSAATEETPRIKAIKSKIRSLKIAILDNNLPAQRILLPDLKL